MRETLHGMDKYKFLQDTDEDQNMGFSHNLIQQAVYTCVLPEKKMEINHHLLFYYEKLVLGSEKKNHLWLSPYIQDLSTYALASSVAPEKKNYYLLIALEGASESGRIIEGLYYCKNLDAIFQPCVTLCKMWSYAASIVSLRRWV